MDQSEIAESQLNLISRCELKLNRAELYTIWRELARMSGHNYTRLIRLIEDTVLYHGRTIPSRERDNFSSTRHRMIKFARVAPQEEIEVSLTREQLALFSLAIAKMPKMSRLKPQMLQLNEMRELLVRIKAAERAVTEDVSFADPGSDFGASELSAALGLSDR